MIDDRIKLLAKRIEQEKPTVYQISLWIEALFRESIQGDLLQSEKLIQEIGVMQSNMSRMMQAIDDVALTHPECAGCQEIHLMLSIGVSYALTPPVAAVAAPND